MSKRDVMVTKVLYGGYFNKQKNLLLPSKKGWVFAVTECRDMRRYLETFTYLNKIYYYKTHPWPFLKVKCLPPLLLSYRRDQVEYILPLNILIPS